MFAFLSSSKLKENLTELHIIHSKDNWFKSFWRRLFSYLKQLPDPGHSKSKMHGCPRGAGVGPGFGPGFGPGYCRNCGLMHASPFCAAKNQGDYDGRG